MQAKIESEDYKLTEDFLQHARVDDKNNDDDNLQQRPNPSKIEKAKKMPLETDTYAKTQKQLEQARIESQWAQKNESEVFPNLSPQAMKEAKIIPKKATNVPPEYKGHVNQEMNELLNKFQQAAHSKEYQESISFEKDQLKQDFLNDRRK